VFVIQIDIVKMIGEA